MPLPDASGLVTPKKSIVNGRPLAQRQSILLQNHQISIHLLDPLTAIPWHDLIYLLQNHSAPSLVHPRSTLLLQRTFPCRLLRPLTSTHLYLHPLLLPSSVDTLAPPSAHRHH